jgi:diadenosine tetraphosphate (Ap4A) HIT family hydrolase
MLILPKIKCCWAKEKPEKTVKQTALFLCFLSINGYTWGHNHEVQQIRKDISPCYEA